MPAPATTDEFLKLLQRSQLLPNDQVEEFLKGPGSVAIHGKPSELAESFVTAGRLTKFQADQLLKGKFRGFTIGKYRVLDRIGAGGMGQVFLCEHPQLKRRAAVKVLPTDRAKDPGLLGRFLREARAAATLDHPHIVRAFDVDSENGLHYLVMEYIEGRDLHRLVREEGPLGIEQACDYIRQGADGLQYAHEAGLIHRDVKPSNFLVDKVGLVKLVDLGLARFTEETGDHLTRRFDGNNVLGTADYVAPEQTRDSHAVDLRCDIYALGGTLYFLLTGRSPFPEGSPSDKMIAHRSRKPTPVRQLRPDVPPGLALVIDKMMAKDPDERYESAAAAAEALTPWLPVSAPASSEPLLPAPSSVLTMTLPERRHHHISLGWSLVAVVVMLGCGLGALAGRWLQGPTAVVRSGNR
ncbi:MAG: serine/threonine-protein kinase [Gemmataceae bacterium]